MKRQKSRLDVLLVTRGLAPSRQKAQAMIMSGVVLVNDVPCVKSGTLVGSESNLRIKGEVSRFVGRGGDKIDKVIDEFGISLENCVAIDVGSSTGGFTDCLLQRGAKLVYAVDVGTNQLDYKLRSDSRVVVMEQTNIKDVCKEDFDPSPSFATIDVSFIGLEQVLPKVFSVLEDGAEVLALVKPQFELGKELVGKGGLVRDPELQARAVSKVEAFSEDLGFNFRGSIPAALKGAKSGNQEHFVFLQKP
ncbi:hypothetical protein BVY02_01165 [bacterium J17]|nr:hypothetical protein BVY02_01165 [bacterium J17]